MTEPHRCVNFTKKDNAYVCFILERLIQSFESVGIEPRSNDHILTKVRGSGIRGDVYVTRDDAVGLCIAIRNHERAVRLKCPSDAGSTRPLIEAVFRAWPEIPIADPAVPIGSDGIDVDVTGWCR